jgi:hypothetical protein
VFTENKITLHLNMSGKRQKQPFSLKYLNDRPIIDTFRLYHGGWGCRFGRAGARRGETKAIKP